MNKTCLITDIKYDKKNKKLTGSFFVAEPRELHNDIPFKDVMSMARKRGLDIGDKNIVMNALLQIIEDNLL